MTFVIDFVFIFNLEISIHEKKIAKTLIVSWKQKTFSLLQADGMKSCLFCQTCHVNPEFCSSLNRRDCERDAFVILTD